MSAFYLCPIGRPVDRPVASRVQGGSPWSPGVREEPLARTVTAFLLMFCALMTSAVAEGNAGE